MLFLSSKWIKFIIKLIQHKIPHQDFIFYFFSKWGIPQIDDQSENNSSELSSPDVTGHLFKVKFYLVIHSKFIVTARFNTPHRR